MSCGLGGMLSGVRAVHGQECGPIRTATSCADGGSYRGRDDSTCAPKLMGPVSVLIAMGEGGRPGTEVEGLRHFEDVGQAIPSHSARPATLPRRCRACGSSTPPNGCRSDQVLRLSACLAKRLLAASRGPSRGAGGSRQGRKASWGSRRGGMHRGARSGPSMRGKRVVVGPSFL